MFDISLWGKIKNGNVTGILLWVYHDFISKLDHSILASLYHNSLYMFLTAHLRFRQNQIIRFGSSVRSPISEDNHDIWRFWSISICSFENFFSDHFQCLVSPNWCSRVIIRFHFVNKYIKSLFILILCVVETHANRWFSSRRQDRETSFVGSNVIFLNECLDWV